MVKNIMSAKILAVTGVPCSGKTTLCKKLEGFLGFYLIDLNKIVSEEGLWERLDKKRDTRVVDTGRLKSRVKKLVVGDTILDGLLSHYLKPTHVLVLRCDPRVLGSRMLKREYSHAKIMENLEAEYSGVILYESLKRCANVLELDNTCGIDLGSVGEWIGIGGLRIMEKDWTGEFEETLSRGF
jgi:adenylate kinase